MCAHMDIPLLGVRAPGGQAWELIRTLMPHHVTVCVLLEVVDTAAPGHEEAAGWLEHSELSHDL